MDYKKQADRLFQQKIKELFPNCLVCNRATQVAHHFVPKSVSNRLRYDLENGIPLCNGCHMRHHQAGDPIIHLTIEAKRGNTWVSYIKKARYQMTKVNVAFYKDAILALTHARKTPKENCINS